MDCAFEIPKYEAALFRQIGVRPSVRDLQTAPVILDQNIQSNGELNHYFSKQSLRLEIALPRRRDVRIAIEGAGA